MDKGAFGKGKGNRGKDSKHSKDKDTNMDSSECWDCGKRCHFSKDCWSKKDQTNTGGSQEKNKNNNTTDAHSPD